MFVNIPENFSSSRDELIFEYTSTEQEDILIELYDNSSGDLLGVKKFYSTLSAKINATPMLYDLLLPEPYTVNTAAIMTQKQGYPRVVAKVDSEQTSELNFIYSSEPVEESTIATTMPFERILYSTECDQVTIVVPTGSSLVAMAYFYPRDEDGSTKSIQYSGSSDGGIKTFYINASSLVETYKTAKIDIRCAGSSVGTLYYSLEQSEPNGYRVAWISSKGSIEHYTFPIIVEQSTLSSGATTTSLRSAYGSQQEMEALSQIVFSPKVWHVEDMEYNEIELLTTEQIVRSQGALMIANIKILENG